MSPSRAAAQKRSPDREIWESVSISLRALRRANSSSLQVWAQKSPPCSGHFGQSASAAFLAPVAEHICLNSKVQAAMEDLSNESRHVLPGAVSREKRRRFDFVCSSVFGSCGGDGYPVKLRRFRHRPSSAGNGNANFVIPSVYSVSVSTMQPSDSRGTIRTLSSSRSLSIVASRPSLVTPDALFRDCRSVDAHCRVPHAICAPRSLCGLRCVRSTDPAELTNHKSFSSCSPRCRFPRAESGCRVSIYKNDRRFAEEALFCPPLLAELRDLDPQSALHRIEKVHPFSHANP
jgi:hypothetical protein